MSSSGFSYSAIATKSGMASGAAMLTGDSASYRLWSLPKYARTPAALGLAGSASARSRPDRMAAARSPSPR